MTLVSVPEQSFAVRLGDVGDGVEVVVWDPEAADPPPAVAAGLEIVLWPDIVRIEAARRLSRLPRLKVVQLQSAGYDHMVASVPPGVSLCNGRGVHSDETAEWAVTLAVAVVRGLPGYLDQQRAHRWEVLPRRTFLAGSHVMVVGAGSIGTEIVRRLRPHRVRVTSVARSSRTGPDGEPVLSFAEALDVLPEVDVVILIVPLTAETHHLVDRDFLARMKDDAYLVNVARGGVVDPEALREACAAGRLTAAIDVVETEPLPPDSPLWDTPNLVITPHVAGEQSRYSEAKVTEILRRQVDACRAGAPLTNVVLGPLAQACGEDRPA